MIKLQDDSMTEEAIQKAEAELQMTKSPAAAKTPRTPAIITSPDTKKAAATPGKENAGPDANTATSPAAKMTPEEVEAKIKARAERCVCVTDSRACAMCKYFSQLFIFAV